jgi:IS30 family transposase
LPASWARTITFDNGAEFYHHQRIATELGEATYFADPYPAYQRGTNQNTDGLLRQDLPKGTSFEHLTQRQLDLIAQELNTALEKNLGAEPPMKPSKSIANEFPLRLDLESAVDSQAHAVVPFRRSLWKRPQQSGKGTA